MNTMTNSVWATLHKLDKPVNAYGMSRLAACSVMDAGRALVALEAAEKVASPDPTFTANDLARRFAAVAG